MDDQAIAGVGHNAPPAYDPEMIEKLKARTSELSDAGGAWLDLGEISTSDQAGKLNDFLTQARTVHKDIETARKAAKQPHIDAGKKVDDTFKALTEPLDKLGVKLKNMLLDFQQAEQKRLDEEKQRQQEQAHREKEEADRLLREAEARNDVLAQAKAEKAAKEAEKSAKAAEKPANARIASATGGGRTMSARTYYRAECENMNKAFSFFRDHEAHRLKLKEFMENLAEAEHRSKGGVKKIPGIDFHPEQRIV